MRLLHRHAASLKSMGKAIPALPEPPEVVSKWTWVGEDYVALWQMINESERAEYQLEDGSTLNEFVRGVVEMQAMQERIRHATHDVAAAVEAKSSHAKAMAGKVMPVRESVMAAFPLEHPIQALCFGEAKAEKPEIKAVGVWSGSASKIGLKWSVPAGAEVLRFEVRMSLTDPYREELERLLIVTENLEALFSPRLGPGISVPMRVYGLMKSGGVMASNTVHVAVPWTE